MCVVSAVHDQYEPYIPLPKQWPIVPAPSTGATPITKVIVNVDLQEQIDELKELIASFRKAVEAAEVFDRLTGQPDCVDPDKAKLVERVEALEKKIAELEADGRADR